MARTYGRVLTATWQDDDWRLLPSDAQHLYLLLVSQPDISPCGVLPYVPRRWAAMAVDLDVEDVEHRLRVLEDRRFVIVDDDTGELVIRSYVRHDGGLANTKMRGAIRNGLEEIHSSTIRRAVEAEIPTEYRESFGLPPVDNNEGMPDRTVIEHRSDGHPIERGAGEGAGVVVTDVPPLTPPRGGGEHQPTNLRALGLNPRGPRKPKAPKNEPGRPSVEREFCNDCGSSTGQALNDAGEAYACPACNPKAALG